VFRTRAEAAFTLGLDPEPVNVAAVPALRIPSVTVLALADDRFELINQDHAALDIAMFLADDFARRGHCRSAVNAIGRMIGTGQCRRGWQRHRRIGNAGRVVGMGRVRFMGGL